jgi:hypothetical protein
MRLLPVSGDKRKGDNLREFEDVNGKPSDK